MLFLKGETGELFEIKMVVLTLIKFTNGRKAFLIELDSYLQNTLFDSSIESVKDSKRKPDQTSETVGRDWCQSEISENQKFNLPFSLKISSYLKRRFQRRLSSFPALVIKTYELLIPARNIGNPSKQAKSEGIT